MQINVGATLGVKNPVSPVTSLISLDFLHVTAHFSELSKIGLSQANFSYISTLSLVTRGFYPSKGTFLLRSIRRVVFVLITIETIMAVHAVAI